MHATARVGNGRVAASITPVKDSQRPEKTFFYAPTSELCIHLKKNVHYHDFDTPCFLDDSFHRADFFFDFGARANLDLHDPNLFIFLRTLDARFSRQSRISSLHCIQNNILSKTAAILKSEARLSAALLSFQEHITFQQQRNVETSSKKDWSLTVLSLVCSGTNLPQRIVICLSSPTCKQFNVRTSRPARLEIQLSAIHNTNHEIINQGDGARFIHEQNIHTTKSSEQKYEAILLDTFEEHVAPKFITVAVADPDHSMTPLFGPRILASATIQIVSDLTEKEIILKPCTNSMFFFLDYAQDQFQKSSLPSNQTNSAAINQQHFRLALKFGQPQDHIISSPRHAFRDRTRVQIPWHLDLKAKAASLNISNDYALSEPRFHFSWQNNQWTSSGSADVLSSDHTYSSQPSFQASSSTKFQAHLNNASSSSNLLNALTLIRIYSRRCIQHFTPIRANRLIDLDSLERIPPVGDRATDPPDIPHATSADTTTTTSSSSFVFDKFVKTPPSRSSYFGSSSRVWSF
uniref:Uncharacterized protein n=1 Tax=Aureoumbra lagunensis TaxID=44058 RepID=A0A7S3NH92_9STRA